MGVMDRYAEFPPFTRAQASHLRRYWMNASKSATSRLIAPALLDVVGRKGERLGTLSKQRVKGCVES